MTYNKNMVRNLSIDKICVTCGKDYIARTGTQKYCSECRKSKYKRGRGKSAPTNYADKMCKMCGDTYTPASGNQIYCAECRYSRQSEYYDKALKGRRKAGDILKTCDVCRNTFKAAGNNHKHCSRCSNMRKHRRVAFTAAYPDYSCNRCGKNDFENFSDIHVHHKNRNQQDNRKDNLELLCHTCHRYEHFVKDPETGKIITNV